MMDRKELRRRLLEAPADLRKLAEAFDWKRPFRRKRETVRWMRQAPFFLMHVAALAVFLVGFSWVALAVALGMWFVRQFAITGFYHRYFSHKSFKTSRPVQFAMAVLGNSAVQKGPLWWAAHHRHHHRYSDDHGDIHSPVKHGFLWSHVGWILSDLSKPTRMKLVPELAKFKELVFLDRAPLIVPVVTGAAMFALGALLQAQAPQLGTSGSQMLVWGFFLSTVVLYHTTYTINSLAHRMGTRRYPTRDDSRNNPILALILLGEGWHNNHHYFPSAARNGFFWWEFDITYYLLWTMSKLGLVWDLKKVPAHVLRPSQPQGA